MNDSSPTLTRSVQYNWSRFYAPGSEIRQYLEDVAAKYRLDRFIRYLHKLTRAEWNEETAQWSLSFDVLNEAGEKVGEKVETADVVIQGMGGLSRWDWPNIPGIHDFKVSLFRYHRLSLFNNTEESYLRIVGQEIALGSVHRGSRGAERKESCSYRICELELRFLSSRCDELPRLPISY